MLQRCTHSHRRLCSPSCSSWSAWLKPSLDIAIVIASSWSKCGQKHTIQAECEFQLLISFLFPEFPSFHISVSALFIRVWQKKSIGSCSVFDSCFPYPQMPDANQQGEIKAIEWVTKLDEFKPSWSQLLQMIFFGGLFYYYYLFKKWHSEFSLESCIVMLILLLDILRVQVELVIQGVIKYICYRTLTHILHLYSLKFKGIACS